MEFANPTVQWPPGTPRAATAGANSSVPLAATSRMTLRAGAPAPPSAGSGGGTLRPLSKTTSDPRKQLASSMSPPFTAVSAPPVPTSPRLRPQPRHISSPRTSTRPTRLADSLSAPGSASLPGSAPASLSVTWGTLTPDDGVVDPALATMSSADQATYMRRYFFTERGFEADRLPSAKHFDVMMADVAPEFAGDHLYCRYVDFLKEEEPRAEDLGLIDEATNSPNTMVIGEWLRNARPRTRLDACPMFFLAKQILINLMDGEVALANRLRENALHSLAELQDEHSTAMTANADALDKAEDRYVDRETTLLDEIGQIKAKLADREAKIAVLTAERDESREEAVGLHKEIARLNSVEEILMQDLERNKEIQEGLKRQLHETTIEVANARADQEQERLNGLQLSNKTLKLKDWKEEATEKMKGLEGDLSASQAHVADLKKTLEELNGTVATMKAEVFDLNEEIAMRKEEGERMQREMERKMKAAANAGAGTTGELRDELNAGVAREEALEKELSDERSKYRALQRQLDELEQHMHAGSAAVEDEKAAQEAEIDELVTQADDLVKVLSNTPAIRAMSPGPEPGPDWRQVEKLYRSAVHARPDSNDLKYKLGKAEKAVQKLNALDYGDTALRDDPSDFATACVAYKQALYLSEKDDPELEFALKISQHGLAFAEANAAVQHGNPSVALEQYAAVLKDLEWVQKVELALEPEPEPEPEQTRGAGNKKKKKRRKRKKKSATAGEDGEFGKTQDEWAEGEGEATDLDAPLVDDAAEGDEDEDEDADEEGEDNEDGTEEEEGADSDADSHSAASTSEEMQAAPASVIESLCGDPARPYAYGRRIVECQAAAKRYPNDPVVKAALKMAKEEVERSANMRSEVMLQLETVEHDEAKKVLAEEKAAAEAKAAQEAAEAARAAEVAAAAGRIAELEQHVEEARQAVEEAAAAAAAQEEAAAKAAEAAEVAKAEAKAAEAEAAAAAMDASAEDMSREQQVEAIKAMQKATKEAQAASDAAIKKAEDEQVRLRAEHEVYERNAVAYKLAQQNLITETAKSQDEIKAEQGRSASAVVAAEAAAETARAAERARFRQSMKGLSRIMTMGLEKESGGFALPDLEEIRQMLLLMVEGGRPMERAMAAAAEKIALANAPPPAPTPEPVVAAPPAPSVTSAIMGTQTDYGYKTGFGDGVLHTPGGTPWESPWTDAPAWGPGAQFDPMMNAMVVGEKGRPQKQPPLRKGGGSVRTGSNKKAMRTVSIGASYSKKNSHGMIGQIQSESSTVWWAKASAPLAVELKCATPPPGPRPAEWEGRAERVRAHTAR